MKNGQFKVHGSKEVFRYSSIFSILLIIVPSLIMLFSNHWNSALFICCFVMDIPFVIGSIWIKNYQIDVNGNQICVRRGFGKRFSFKIEDIEQVVQRITHTGQGATTKYTIYEKNNTFSIDYLMIGYKQMEDYILENIPLDKIITKEKTLSKTRE